MENANKKKFLSKNKTGLSLSNLSYDVATKVLSYLLLNDFLDISCGPSTYVDNNGKPMNSSAFASSNEYYIWTDDDFYSVRDDKTPIPDSLINEAVSYFEVHPDKMPEKSPWKRGLAPMLPPNYTMEDYQNLLCFLEEEKHY